MSIQNITPDDLRQMQDQEALILQGCGGDPQEWMQNPLDRTLTSTMLPKVC